VRRKLLDLAVVSSVSPQEQALSVGQVWRRSRNALAREFRQAVWVAGEIKSLREWRGNWYLTLVEPGGNGDGSDITLDVACSPKRRLVIQNQLAQAGIGLAAGMQVRIYGPITIGRLGKLQAELQQLDTSALVGAHELEKRRVVEALRTEGIIDANRRRVVPLVPLRVGLVGSDGSDGVKDFLGRLQLSTFAFEVTMRHSPVQGPAAVPALAQAVRSLQSEPIDVLVIVRGGGGELDAFDKEPVVRSIAQSRLPIWVGIGHTADQGLADLVANASFVTPTACGDALVERVGAYRRHVLQALQQVNRHVQQSGSRMERDVQSHIERLARHASTWADLHHNRLFELLRHVQRSGVHSIVQAQGSLRVLAAACDGAVRRTVASSATDVGMQRQQLKLLDPKRQLERGYAVVRRADGSALRQVSQVSMHDDVQVVLGRGTFGATVTRVDAIEEAP
jgi:exodeoxyribonuclease VII large subunit